MNIDTVTVGGRCPTLYFFLKFFECFFYIYNPR